MKNRILFSIILAGALVSAACQKSSDDEPSPPSKDRFGFTSVPAHLHGRWISVCLSEGSRWSKYELNFNETAFSGNVQVYEDPACTRSTSRLQKIEGELRAKWPVYSKNDVFLTMDHKNSYDSRFASRLNTNFLVSGYPGMLSFIEATSAKFPRQAHIVFFPDSNVPGLDGGVVAVHQRLQGIFRSACRSAAVGYEQTQITLAKDRLLVDSRGYSNGACTDDLTLQSRQGGNFLIKNILFDRRGSALVEFAGNPVSSARTLYALVVPDSDQLTFFTANQPLPSILLIDDYRMSRENYATIGLTPLWEVQPFARPMDPTVAITRTNQGPKACGAGGRLLAQVKAQNYYHPFTKNRISVAGDCEFIDARFFAGDKIGDNFVAHLDNAPRLILRQGSDGLYVRVQGSVADNGITVHTWEIAPSLMLNGGEKIYQFSWSSQPCSDTPDKASDEYLNVTETYVTGGTSAVCTAYGNKGNL